MKRTIGLIWPEGRGVNSPANQAEALEMFGISKLRISSDPPPPREGEIIVATCVDAFGAHPITVAARYADMVRDGGAVEVIETEKTYAGIDGLVALLRDWFSIRRRRQTEAAREAPRARRKGKIPLWVRRLSPADRQAFCHDYLNQIASDDELGRRYGVSRQSVWRAAKAMNLERIPLDE